ncbi:Cytochrome c oxidase subunit 4 [Coemansia javaensis]|uniref:Cytochrome c oxidase subunit 4 n=1 Tax=Coemansia javaensis TaxID=2761396 RepID=A0A9W8HEJ0_9FUNG|nr:Cytochrome c oxidase subunit 4 [Coemansia javaensis]
MLAVARRSLASKAAPAVRAGLARSTRAFSAAAVRQGGGEKGAILQGPGPRPGFVPTNFEQSTGDERKEFLAAQEGKAYYDMGPLVLAKKGTRSDPTIVPSGAAWRLVGCNGAPGESHELMWIRVERSHGIDRCPECGNVYKLSDTGFDPENLGPFDPHHAH